VWRVVGVWVIILQKLWRVVGFRNAGDSGISILDCRKHVESSLLLEYLYYNPLSPFHQIPGHPVELRHD
jgi:hypothetical protein